MDGNQRCLGFTPTEEYFAKGCFGISGMHKLPRLGENIPNDFLTNLFSEMQQCIAEENKIYEAEKENYNKAIKVGEKLVAKIKDAETCNAAVKEIEEISHALTSKKEIGAMARVRVSELGLRWNKDAKAYE